MATVMTSTARSAPYVVATSDGRVHLFRAVDVLDLAGRVQFFTGRVLPGDVPEVVASFRSSAVLWWRCDR